ncbi:MAG: hypothetical protein M3336_17175, partial [Chloroflexota bacterium]|nr:hypothetical protein [Chloroflexota bacterium]
AQPATWARAGRVHSASVSARLDGEGVDVQIGQRVLRARWLGTPGAEQRVRVDGETLSVRHARRLVLVEWRGRGYRLERPAPLSVEDTAADPGVAGGAGRLSAPMPGRIVKIAVRQGERVRSNQPLVVLEAMKMEHLVEAPHAGVVGSLAVHVGQQVAAGALLLELADEPHTD